MHRRKFINQGAATLAGITILNFPVFGKNAPSNKVITAVMGVNSRGAYLAENFAALPNVEVAYICDVEETAIANGMKSFKNSAKPPRVVRDIRSLLAQKDFDALIVAAPDHWHAPAAIMAASNGKHVYVEKPCGHNPAEGELMIKAAERTGKIIQMGNQRRSMPTLIEAVSLVKSGAIGVPYFAKAWYANNRKSIGYGAKVPVPKTIDFELWQGPAARADYRDNLVHYNWHWFWNWGTGEACNNGTHEIDCCRWFLDAGYPNRVNSSGGRYAYKDDWQTPDTQVATFEFPDNKAISWEGRSCNNLPVEGSGRGFIIYGTNGSLINLGGGDYKIFDATNKPVRVVTDLEKPDPSNPVSANGNLDLYHFNNFIESVRGNQKPNSPMTEAHPSVLLCHLANIAHRTETTLVCNPENGHIVNNRAAQQFWAREYAPGWSPKI